jgi:small GTP-binding protein
MSWFSNKNIPDTKRAISMVFCGDGNVGKTTWFKRLCAESIAIENYVHDTNYEASSGAEISTITLDTNIGPITLYACDTAGQVNFDSMRGAYVRGADLAIVMYDQTNRQTLNNVEKWTRFLGDECKDRKQLPIIAVCGNKIDLKEECYLLGSANLRDARLKSMYPNGTIDKFDISVKESTMTREALGWLLTKHYKTEIKVLKKKVVKIKKQPDSVVRSKYNSFLGLNIFYLF